MAVSKTTAKTTTKNPAAAAKPAAAKPKPAAKPATAATPKAATAKTAAPPPKKAAAGPKSEKRAIAPDQRRNYVEVAAYFIAERHGFTPGRELADWAAAEAEIDRLLAEGRITP